MRRTFTAEFKARVGLEAVRGEKTVQEIGTLYEVHPNRVSDWKIYRKHQRRAKSGGENHCAANPFSQPSASARIFFSRLTIIDLPK
ncbi:hypothetical protein FACS1894139_16820 [Planctomycetales bacterium]|nr:hypothetical protein FACS1894107_15730 [Planctomycetales bacterium]GHT00662.1 hypothetical protein FACS1894108_13250 [Planctomycetales bacterium]GHT07869.1 hypothetical protein FACS1894139_16820 [Planctomycetales bacterium]